MNSFEAELDQRLISIACQGLRRELRRVDSAQSREVVVQGESLLNFSSNDYLGLANHSALKAAAAAAVERFGAGSGASRLICGSLEPFHQLEDRLAHFKRTEAALTFSSGYAAALGTVCALMSKQDVLVLDKKIHACFVDAARLCGARLRIFAHNDLEDLQRILEWAKKYLRTASESPSDRKPRCLIVTESVFSMDGDHAPLKEIVELKEKYGAWLMVDEAHATGVYGSQGRGLAEELGVADRIEVQMGTLGKALGASGGYICGSRRLVEFLVNQARTFIFSTAPVPATASAASVGIEIVQSEEGRALRKALSMRVRQLTDALQGNILKPSGPIIPVIIGAEASALKASNDLRRQGLFVPAIRFPAVPRHQARLRLTITARHKAEDISILASALQNQLLAFST